MLDNVNSKYILQEIFGKLEIIRKLKIVKYNKRIKAKLDIKKEDYEILLLPLKEFNNKYNTNIEDIFIQELNLSQMYIGNEGLNDLAKIKFKKIKILDLSENNISYIDILEKLNYI